MQTPGTSRAVTHLTMGDCLTPPPTPAPTEFIHVTLKEEKKRWHCWPHHYYKAKSLTLGVGEYHRTVKVNHSEWMNKWINKKVVWKNSEQQQIDHRCGNAQQCLCERGLIFTRMVILRLFRRRQTPGSRMKSFFFKDVTLFDSEFTETLSCKTNS